MRLFRCCLMLMGLVGTASAAVDPVAVSPGGAGEFSVASSSCPTFSWGAVDGAEVYELAVLEVRTGLPAPVVEGDASRVVLRAKIPGSALSWTPPRERCMAPGRYSWSVRGARGSGSDGWSEPLFFEVSEVLRLTEDELRVAVERLVKKRLEQAVLVSGATLDGAGMAGSENRPAEASGLNGPEPAFLTGASAAILGVAVSGNQVAGVAGVASDVDAAGVVASNDVGPDLILDAPNVTAPGIEARLRENSLERNSPGDTSFSFRNNSAGVLDLSVDGRLSVGTVLQLNATNSPPPCDSSILGGLYWDTNVQEVCDCNGTSWQQVDGGGAC